MMSSNEGQAPRGRGDVPRTGRDMAVMSWGGEREHLVMMSSGGRDTVMMSLIGPTQR